MIPLHATQLIEAIRLTGKKLTPKENGFLATVHVVSKSNRLISDRQAKWLQDIYAKVNGGGQYENKDFIR